MTINTDCIDYMRDVPAETYSSIVTDPPYFLLNKNGMGFMNKDWDGIINLWQYYLCLPENAQRVVDFLKLTVTELSTAGEGAVAENASINISQVDSCMQENKSNALCVKQPLLFQKIPHKNFVQCAVFTKLDLQEYLKLKNIKSETLCQYLNGEKKFAVYVIPHSLLQKELTNSALKNAITRKNPTECAERKITFTEMEMGKISDLIAVQIGNLLGEKYIKEMGINANYAESIAPKKRYSAIILSHIKVAEAMKAIISLLCVTSAIREQKNPHQFLVDNFNRAWMTEAYRITKHGGFMLAFGSPRLVHRMGVAAEDAGWEVRNNILWLYLTAMPKAMSIPMLIDKKKKAQKHRGKGFNHAGRIDRELETGKYGREYKTPKTPLAKQFDGFKTPDLKTMYEPILFCMKPTDGSFADNAEKHGIAGINVGGCRIGDDTININRFDDDAKPFGGAAGCAYHSIEQKGRYPTNIIISEDVAEMIDSEIPHSKNGICKKTDGDGTHKNFISIIGGKKQDSIIDEGGGQSRMFFIAKPTTLEKELGLHNYKTGTAHIMRPDKGEPTGVNKEKGFAPRERKNIHTTVKPISLMQYLIRMVSPPTNAKILDPFAGSGTTGIAAHLERVECDMVEQNTEYYDIICERMSHIENMDATTAASLQEQLQDVKEKQEVLF